MNQIISEIVSIIDRFYCFGKSLYLENARITRTYYDEISIYIYGKIDDDIEEECLNIVNVLADGVDIKIKNNKIIINDIVLELKED